MTPIYIYDEDLIKQCDRLPAVTGRASMVNSLLESYKLLKHLKLVKSTPASYEILKDFHSELYIDHLKSIINIDDEYMCSTQDEDYGIGYDCPPVSDMYELITSIAGGSVTAARCLTLELSKIAINWCGGWHHAQRFCAEGFCYVNDIVLAIEQLRKKFPKVLYIDLDVHHGNGVQDAYNLSKSVFTLSLHKYEPGFYPGTGGLDDIGSLTGKGYACNIPLHASYNDETLVYVFNRVFAKINEQFCPEAIVIQCGADALAHDPNGGAALTSEGYIKVLRTVLDTKKPTLILGGGGYNHPNTARLWVSLTAEVIGVKLHENIPEHDNWPLYGPDYTLAINPTLVKDSNKKMYLDECINSVTSNISTFIKPEIKNSLKKKNIQISRNVIANKVDHNPYKITSDVITKDVFEFSE